MLKESRYFHWIFAFYSIMCFGTYLTYEYKFLHNSFLIAVLLLVVPKLKYAFTKERVLLFLLLFALFIYSSISAVYGFQPRRDALLLPLLAFMSKEDIQKTFQCFLWIQIVSLIPSLIVLLAYISGLDTYIPSHTVDWGRPFIVYPGTVVQPGQIVNFNGITLQRISGIQGEPGGVGAVNILLLIGQSFDLKSKKNKFLLFTGLLSFSLAFYLLLLAYISLSVLVDENIRKAIVKNKFSIIFFIVFFFSSGLFSFFISDRVEDLKIDESGVNSTRTTVTFSEYFDFYFSQNTKHIIFGHGGGANSQSNAYEGSKGINYMAFLYNYGFLGFFLFFYTLFYLVFNKSFSSIAFVFIILLSFYQRPSMIDTGYFLLFFSIAYSLNDKIKKQLN